MDRRRFMKVVKQGGNVEDTRNHILLTLATTSENQKVQLFNGDKWHQNCWQDQSNKMIIEVDGEEGYTTYFGNDSAFYYTFANIGEHTIKLVFSENVKSLYNAFNGRTYLTADFSHFDWSEVINVYQALRLCNNLVNVNLGNFCSQNIDCSYMLYGAHLSNLVASSMSIKPTDCRYMFACDGNGKGTYHIPRLDEFDMSVCTSCYKMFMNHIDDFGGIEYWDMGNVTNTYAMFSGAETSSKFEVHWELKSATLAYRIFHFSTITTDSYISVGDISHTTDLDEIISWYRPISEFRVTNLPKLSWNLRNSSISAESVLSIVNALPQLDTGLDDDGNVKESYTLTLGATLLAKLTSEQKAIATNKGWTLA